MRRATGHWSDGDVVGNGGEGVTSVASTLAWALSASCGTVSPRAVVSCIIAVTLDGVGSLSHS